MKSFIALVLSMMLVSLAHPAMSFDPNATEQKLTASDGAAWDWFGYAVSISGDYAIVGAMGGEALGSAYIFERSDGSWNEVAKLTASDGADRDDFGCAVSISGDYAIVGSDQDDDNGDVSGSAYIFEHSGGTWNEVAKLTASDGAAWDWFGYSVSISGNYAIVGAIGNGSAYVFEHSGTTWSEIAKLTGSDEAAGTNFGSCVSISGDYAVVGTRVFTGDPTGSAYIFERSGITWSEVAKTSSDGATEDWFGSTVSISGDYAIVGAMGGEAPGSAYIFERSGSSWSKAAKLTASGPAASWRFGWTVSISGDCAVVGDDNGSAYVFARSGGCWGEVAKLTASDGAASDKFGRCVSISGNDVIVGAFLDDDNGKSSGSAYCYTFTGPRIYVSEITPGRGGYGTIIQILGTGFGGQQSGVSDTSEGYHSFVTFSNEHFYPYQLVATTYPSWSNTEAVVKFENLLLDNDGDFLSDAELRGLLPPGDYDLVVSTVLFNDSNGSGTYDDGDEVTVISSICPVTFTLTNEPVISQVYPRYRERKKLVRITGNNFGAAWEDGDSVRIGKWSGYSSNPTTKGIPLRIYRWSDTRIGVYLWPVPVAWEDTYKFLWVVKRYAGNPVASNGSWLKIVSPSP